MGDSLDAMAWPVESAGEAMRALARVCGLPLGQAPPPPAPGWLPSADPAQLHTWLLVTADWLGLEAERISEHYPDFDRVLARATPALLCLPGARPRLLAVVGRKGRCLRLLGPDRIVHSQPMTRVRALVCADLEAGAVVQLEKRRGEEARVGPAAMIGSRLHDRWLRGVLADALVERLWLLRSPPGEHFWHQLKHAGLARCLAWLLLGYLAQAALLLASWGILGRAVFRGPVDTGWLAAWALTLLSLVPARMLTSWSSGRITVLGGALIRQRLLARALVLPPAPVRLEGLGQMLGKIFEAENLETLAFNGGLIAMAAAVDLATAFVTFALGHAPVAGALLLGCLLGVAALARARLRAREAWTHARLTLTHDLTERLAGHRTRLIQEPRDRWHDLEELTLEPYLENSQRLERYEVALLAAAPELWLCGGILSVVPALVMGGLPSAEVVIAIGGVLVAHQGLKKLTFGLDDLVGALTAWRQLQSIFRAHNAELFPAPPELVQVAPTAPATPSENRPPLIAASRLAYRPTGRTELVLRDLDLEIAPGERLLLQGPSGGGKSTLAGLLAGLHAPTSGLLLLDGLDRRTLGLGGWRSRVVAVPQFHENHVFTGTLAFNLMMGRDWPCLPAELEEAEEVCRALGLEDLLAKMPGGLHQIVGETGWQLSHGERSRLFIARALLQRADLLILDESLAALDPHTMKKVASLVLARAKTLLLVAHP